MEITAPQIQQECAYQCESQFVTCSVKQFTGCVESLRVCRETCRPQPVSASSSD